VNGVKRLNYGCVLLHSLLFIGTAYAAPPIPFGQWDSQSGSVTASCPQGASCEIIVESPGFLQQSIIDEFSDLAKIHTIILGNGLPTGNADSLPFSSENFVQGNDPLDPSTHFGLASRQIIKESTSNSFDASDVQVSIINIMETGWAADDGQPNIINEQLVNESGGKFNSEFAASFIFEANVNETGKQTGSSVRLDQEFIQPMGRDQPITTSSGWRDNDCGSSCNLSAEDTVAFALGITSGDMTPAGEVTLPSGTVSWIEGDVASAMWTGQIMNHWESLEDFESDKYLPGFEALKVEHLSYENRTTGQVARHMQYGGDINPDIWLNDPFGPTPSVAVVIEGKSMPDEDSRSRDSSWGSSSPAPDSTNQQPLPGTVGAQYAFQPKDVSLEFNGPVDAVMDFSRWDVINGAISIDCSLGITCSGNGQRGNGFLQQIVSDDNTGKQYIQTIVTDMDATGSAGALTFSSETLVALNSDEDGMLNLQLMKGDGPGNQNGFSDRTVIRTGWADSPSLPTVEFTQHLAAIIPQQGFEFSSKFEYKANIDETSGSPTGFLMDIEQISKGSFNLVPQLIDTSRRDDWMFVRREVAGDMLTSSGSASTGSGDRWSGSRGGSSSNSSISWQPGDDIKVTWVGQVFDFEDRDTERAFFAYQTYDNISDDFPATRETDPEDGPSPFNWLSVFGSAPLYPFDSSGGGDGRR